LATLAITSSIGLPAMTFPGQVVGVVMKALKVTWLQSALAAEGMPSKRIAPNPT
jgi:hypothetical protein